ncbi:hypothetical protein MCHI_001423 [Candidatus Magnetoovum chiemensis]|nr:hypothetical protein MCHI_001423 [Candidatus Magnetoovum chiemensis]
MADYRKVDIDFNVECFLCGRKPENRYASFDYCYNYFRSYKEEKKIHEIASEKNLQLSCFQLGFYLASWGMYVRKTIVLQKSVKYLEPLIRWIAGLDESYWDIDVDKYNDDGNIDKLLRLYKMIGDCIKDKATGTLITKIMLGVFANVPALDENFVSGFCGKVSSRAKELDEDWFCDISEFYETNRKIIDAYKIKTLDFSSGDDTSYCYTKAKITDMVFFIEGIPITVERMEKEKIRRKNKSKPLS